MMSYSLFSYIVLTGRVEIMEKNLHDWYFVFKSNILFVKNKLLLIKFYLMHLHYFLFLAYFPTLLYLGAFHPCIWQLFGNNWNNYMPIKIIEIFLNSLENFDG